MLAGRLNYMVHLNQVTRFSIIKIKEKFSFYSRQMWKRILVIMQVDVLTPGCEVGEKLGSPVQLNFEGKLPEGDTIQGAIELMGKLEI